MANAKPRTVVVLWFLLWHAVDARNGAGEPTQGGGQLIFAHIRPRHFYQGCVEVIVLLAGEHMSQLSGGRGRLLPKALGVGRWMGERLPQQQQPEGSLD